MPQAEPSVNELLEGSHKKKKKKKRKAESTLEAAAGDAQNGDTAEVTLDISCSAAHFNMYRSMYHPGGSIIG